jgi:hypothetical protein
VPINKSRHDARAKFGAQRLGAQNPFLRIGNVGGRDLIDDLGRQVAQHPLGADIEDLDDAVRVRGNA